MGRAKPGMRVAIIIGIAAVTTWGCGPDGPDIPGDAGNGGDGTGGMVDGGGPGVDGYSGRVESELEDDTEAGTLSDDQQYQLCRAGFEFVTDNISLDEVCLWAAHARASSPDYENDEAASSACEQSRTQWEENRDPEFDPCDGISGAQECAGTVEDWEQCEQALSVEFFEHIAELPVCSETTASYYSDEYQTYPPPERGVEQEPEPCRLFRRSCPEFYSNWIGPVKNP